MSGIANWQAQIRIDIEDLKKRIKVAEGEINNFTNEDRKVKLDIDTKTLESAIQKLDKMLDSIGKGTGDFKQFENLSKELSSIVSEVQSLSKAFGKMDDSGAKTLLSSIQNIDKSLSELSQNILNVNKNMSNMGDNTSGAVKQVENIGTAYQDAAKEAEKLADAQSKTKNDSNISSNLKEATNTINEYFDAVTKLNNIKASDKKTGNYAERIADQEAEVKKLESSFESADPSQIAKFPEIIEKIKIASQGSSESVARLADSLRNMQSTNLSSWDSNIVNFQKKIDDITSKNWDSPAFVENFSKLKEAVSEYKAEVERLRANPELIDAKSIQGVKTLKQNVKNASDAIQRMSAVEKGLDQLSAQKEIDKINKLLEENTRMSDSAKAKINAFKKELMSGDPSANLKTIHTEILKIYNDEVEAGRAGRTFMDTLKDKAWYGWAAQVGGMFGFYDVINKGKEAFDVIKDLDYALVDLKKTTAMNESQLESYYYSSNDVAKQMGVTTGEIIDQSSAWSRLGYNTAQASKTMAELSSQFSSISPGMDTTTSQEGLVSIMKAWNIDYSDVKSEIMDNINALGNSMAEDNQDIVEGMERSAAALAAVGTSYKDAFAMFSGIQEVLQNAEVSGRALRSISMRIRGYDESTEELSSDLENITGDLIDLTKTAEHTQGVSIFKDGSTTEFKSLVDYFGQINQIWDEMSQKQQNDFLQKAFGKTQAQAGAALIQNYSAVTKSLKVMEEAAGSSDREMDTVRQSITYKLNNLEQTWVGTVQNILDRGDLGTIVDGLTKVSEAVGFLTSNLGLLGTAGNTISGILGAKGLGLKSKFTSQPL